MEENSAKHQLKAFLQSEATNQMESPQKNRKSYGQGALHMPTKLILNQAKINKKGEKTVMPTKLDLNQLMYFQGSHHFTDTRLNSAGLSDLPSGHIINTGHNVQADSTPQSVSYKNPSNSKKLRNLKNFSAQSAVIDQATFNSINQNQAKASQIVNLGSGQHNEQPPEFQQNVFLKLNESNVQRQQSTKNVRRNTQVNSSKYGGGPLGNLGLGQGAAERAGSRYKAGKQQSVGAHGNQRGAPMSKSINYNNQRPSNSKMSIINKSRQSFKEITDKSFNDHIKSDALQIAQQYQSQQHPTQQKGQNFNMLRHSVQQDNFIGGNGGGAQATAMAVNGQINMVPINSKSLAMHVAKNPTSIQKNSQVQQALSKSAALQKQVHQKYQNQLLQQQVQQNSSLGNREALLQIAFNQQQQQQQSQKHMLLRNQKMANKTPQIVAQKSANFPRKLTINSNSGPHQAETPEVPGYDLPQQIQNLKASEDIANLQEALLQQNQSPTFLQKERAVTANYMKDFQITSQAQQLGLNTSKYKQSYNPNNKKNDRYVKSGKANRGEQLRKVNNLDVMSAAQSTVMNYIEAPLKINSVQGCRSPKVYDEHASKEICDSKLTSGTNISQSGMNHDLAQYQHMLQQQQSHQQESRFTPSTFNNEMLDGLAAPSSCSRQMRTNNTQHSGPDSPQKVMQPTAYPQKNKTESRQGKHCLIQKNKGHQGQMDAQTYQSRTRQKQNSINDMRDDSNRNRSMARRGGDTEHDDLKKEVMNLLHGHTMHAQSVQESAQLFAGPSQHQTQKQNAGKTRDVVQTSMTGQSIFQIYNQRIKVVSGGAVINSKNLSKNKQKVIQQQLVQKIQQQEQFQKYLAQQSQLTTGKQLQSQQSQENSNTTNTNELSQNHSQSKSFGSAQRKKKIVKVMNHQQQPGTQHIVLNNKTKKELMKKLKNQHFQIEQERIDKQRQIHNSSTLNQDNGAPSVFDQAKGQNGMNNMNINQMQPYQRDQLIRISQQQKNLPDFHQMMVPHHDFALHSQHQAKESERVDDLFQVGLHQRDQRERECSTSPTREVQSPFIPHKPELSPQNISELYEPDLQHLNSRGKVIHYAQNKQPGGRMDQHLVNESAPGPRMPAQTVVDWRRASNQQQHSNQLQVKPVHLQNQYNSRTTYRNGAGTYTTSYESQDMAETEHLRKSTSSHGQRRHPGPRGAHGGSSVATQQLKGTKARNKGMTTHAESPHTQNLIVIQTNNFSSLKQSQDLLDDLREKQARDTMMSNDPANKSLRQPNNHGLNHANESQGGMVKNSQSQKRLNQMRKQMNKNRLKDLPNKIHETANVGLESNKLQKNQSSDRSDNSLLGPNISDLRQLDNNDPHRSQEVSEVPNNQGDSLEQDQQQNIYAQQIKKPPQVPSLGTKIQYAQKQQIGQLPETQICSGGVSAGVSAISTVGGTAANMAQNAQGADARTGTDYLSSNNNQNLHYKNEQDNYRKNSSILSTANRNYLQINTPSALGYTSVLLGGTTQTAGAIANTGGQYGLGQAMHNFSLYGNIQYHEDPDVFAEQLVFDQDQALLDQYRYNEDFKLCVDPLGEANNPFMALQYEPMFQNLIDDDFQTEQVIGSPIRIQSADNHLVTQQQESHDASILREHMFASDFR